MRAIRIRGGASSWWIPFLSLTKSGSGSRGRPARSGDLVGRHGRERGASGIWWVEAGVPLNSLWHIGCPPSRQIALAPEVTALGWRQSNPRRAFSPSWLEVYPALPGVLGLLVNCGWCSAQEGQSQPCSLLPIIEGSWPGRRGNRQWEPTRLPIWEGFSTPSTLGEAGM